MTYIKKINPINLTSIRILEYTTTKKKQTNRKYAVYFERQHKNNEGILFTCPLFYCFQIQKKNIKRRKKKSNGNK